MSETHQTANMQRPCHAMAPSVVERRQPLCAFKCFVNYHDEARIKSNNNNQCNARRSSPRLLIDVR